MNFVLWPLVGEAHLRNKHFVFQSIWLLWANSSVTFFLPQLLLLFIFWLIVKKKKNEIDLVDETNQFNVFAACLGISI